jgi:hypothetical protein
LDSIPPENWPPVVIVEPLGTASASRGRTDAAVAVPSRQIACSLELIPCSLELIPCSLEFIPCSLEKTSLFMVAGFTIPFAAMRAARPDDDAVALACGQRRRRNRP